MRWSTIPVILVACALAWSAQGARKPAPGKIPDRTDACKHSPRLAGACFVVRGELEDAGGQDGLRILSLGSDRQLKIVDAEDQEGEEASLLPRSVDKALTKEGVDAEIIASLTMCPLTPRRAGWVQHVCVAGATRVRAHNPDEEHPPAPATKARAAKPAKPSSELQP